MYFIGRSQSRNQEKGAKGASAIFWPSHLENINKKQSFKRVLDLI